MARNFQEQLASLTTTNQDLQMRAGRWKAAEEAAHRLEHKCRHLQDDIYRLEQQEHDLKHLMECMKQEQAGLREHNTCLIEERNALVKQGETLRTEEGIADHNQRLQQDVDNWKSIASDRERALVDKDETLRQGQIEIQTAAAVCKELQQWIQSLEQSTKELQSQLETKDEELCQTQKLLSAKALQTQPDGKKLNQSHMDGMAAKWQQTRDETSERLAEIATDKVNQNGNARSLSFIRKPLPASFGRIVSHTQTDDDATGANEQQETCYPRNSRSCCSYQPTTDKA